MSTILQRLPPLLALPSELKTTICQMVRDQDEACRIARLRLLAEPDKWEGRGLSAISMVASDLRRHAAPFLFDTLRSTTADSFVFCQLIFPQYSHLFTTLELDSREKVPNQKTLALAAALPLIKHIRLHRLAARAMFEQLFAADKGEKDLETRVVTTKFISIMTRVDTIALVNFVAEHSSDLERFLIYLKTAPCIILTNTLQSGSSLDFFLHSNSEGIFQRLAELPGLRDLRIIAADPGQGIIFNQVDPSLFTNPKLTSLRLQNISLDVDVWRLLLAMVSLERLLLATTYIEDESRLDPAVSLGPFLPNLRHLVLSAPVNTLDRILSAFTHCPLIYLNCNVTHFDSINLPVDLFSRLSPTLHTLAVEYPIWHTDAIDTALTEVRRDRVLVTSEHAKNYWESMKEKQEVGLLNVAEQVEAIDEVGKKAGEAARRFAKQNDLVGLRSLRRVMERVGAYHTRQEL